MSAISHAETRDGGLVINNIFSNISKILKGFFVTKDITRDTSIYHGDFSYNMVPDTAIRNFNNINNVTMLKAGDCYIYVFEKPGYQGSYCIIKPGETYRPEYCGSVIVSTRTVPVNAVSTNATPPEWCWEMSGPMYLWHFSPLYKYA